MLHQRTNRRQTTAADFQRAHGALHARLQITFNIAIEALQPVDCNQAIAVDAHELVREFGFQRLQ